MLAVLRFLHRDSCATNCATEGSRRLARLIWTAI